MNKSHPRRHFSAITAEEIDFKNEDKIDTSIARVLELVSLFNSDETIDVHEIFNAKQGVQFGEQVDQLIEFTIKGQLLTLLPPALDFVMSNLAALEAGTFSQFMLSQKEKHSDDDIKGVQAMEELAGKVDRINLKEGFDSLPTQEDRAWYFSFTILALYAYLDVYTKSLVDAIESNKHLSVSFEKYLLDFSIESFNALKNMSIGKRLSVIENGLRIDTHLIRIVSERNLQIYRTGLTKFIRIRGRVAHSNPKLNHEQYSYEDLEKEMDDIVVDFGELDQFVEKIGFAQYELQQMKKSVSEAGKVLNKVRLVLMMAIVYPALIDASLSVLMNDE